MSKVSGQVFKVYDKQWGNKTLFSLKLENDPIFYRMNENRGAGIVEPGNWIEFDANPNSDGKSATVTGKPSIIAPPAQAASAPATGAVYQGGGGSARETSIHYQAARKDALTLLGIAIPAGAIVLPAKAAAKLKALDALVDFYTALYFEDTSTGGAVTRAQEAAYTETDEDDKPAKAKKSKAAVEVEDSDDEDDDE
jgi:hypothetical protein